MPYVHFFLVFIDFKFIIADVRDALVLLWGRAQIATTSQIGVVLESAEVLVDNSTGEMTIGVVDDGTF